MNNLVFFYKTLYGISDLNIHNYSMSDCHPQLFSPSSESKSDAQDSFM